MNSPAIPSENAQVALTAKQQLDFRNEIKAESKTPRSQCLKIIASLVGDAGIQAFLKTSQPDLGDRTGGQMLQDSPSELLQLLNAREAQNDFDDELIDELTVVDPYAGDPPNRRSDKELGRLLDLLDSLDERGNG